MSALRIIPVLSSQAPSQKLVQIVLVKHLKCFCWLLRKTAGSIHLPVTTGHGDAVVFNFLCLAEHVHSNGFHQICKSPFHVAFHARFHWTFQKLVCPQLLLQNPVMSLVIKLTRASNKIPYESQNALQHQGSVGALTLAWARVVSLRQWSCASKVDAGTTSVQGPPQNVNPQICSQTLSPVLLCVSWHLGAMKF